MPPERHRPRHRRGVRKPIHPLRAGVSDAMATAVPLPRPLPTPLLRLRSDEQLLALFRAGREDAFRALHDRYHERLLAYVRHMLRGSSEAEDVVQDVFMRAYGALRSGEREIAVRPWLYRVAHNRCIDYVRRAPAPPLQPDELIPGGTDPVDRGRAPRGPAAARRRPPRPARAAALRADHPRARGPLLRGARDRARRDRAGRQVAARARPQRARRGRRGARHRLRPIREELALAVDRPGRPPRLLRDHLRVCDELPRPPPGAAPRPRPAREPAPRPVVAAARRLARRRCSARAAAAPRRAATGSALVAGATKTLAVALGLGGGGRRRRRGRRAPPQSRPRRRSAHHRRARPAAPTPTRRRVVPRSTRPPAAAARSSRRPPAAPVPSPSPRRQDTDGRAPTAHADRHRGADGHPHADALAPSRRADDDGRADGHRDRRDGGHPGPARPKLRAP